MNLIRMVRQKPLLRVTFLADGAVLSRPGSDYLVALPLVFSEGVGGSSATNWAGLTSLSARWPSWPPRRMLPFRSGRNPLPAA